MKKIFLSALLLCLALNIKAQQEFHTIMHHFVPQLRQVAYSATKEEVNLTLLYCNQWRGIEGNPQNTLFSGHYKIKSGGLAIGAIANQEKCGIKTNSMAELIFSYGINLKNSLLAFGIGSSFNSMKWDISDLSDEEVRDLASLSRTPDCCFLSFRAGLYLCLDNFYFGATVSNLNKFKSNFYTPKPHGYITSGYKAQLTKKLTLNIEGNVQTEQFTGYAPDISATLASDEKLFAGLSYRAEKNIGFHIKVNFSRRLYVGAAYEHAANELRKSHTASTFEFIFGFRQPVKNEPPASWDNDRLLF